MESSFPLSHLMVSLAAIALGLSVCVRPLGPPWRGALLVALLASPLAMSWRRGSGVLLGFPTRSPASPGPAEYLLLPFHPVLRDVLRAQHRNAQTGEGGPVRNSRIHCV